MKNKAPDKMQMSDIPYPTHGGNPAAMARHSGTDPEKLIDFSASINPLGPPPCVSQLLLETPHLIYEYPDPESTALKKIIARSENVPEDWIRVTNGSTELIYLLPFLFSTDQELLIIDPFFSEYEKSFSRFNIKIHSHVLSPEEGFKIDFPALLHQLNSIDKLSGIVLGHPNSPTGNTQNHVLKQLMEYCRARNITLFIDETFMDFLPPQISTWNTFKQNPHLVIIKSLTKFYSLPGLRIGYGILSPEKIKRIATHQNPWAVNSLAQFIGAEVLQDSDFQKKSRAWLQSEKKIIQDSLSQIREVQFFPTETNFILFRLLNSDLSRDLFSHLLSDEILLRNCGNFTGLDENFFRLSFRMRKDNLKLLDSLKQFFIKSD